ncbi:MAG: lycopene cyclase domain-containing protein [Bacteroidota bacterium]|nr:lycopene cyclase domain-containing protein [Bacteroidota bacterium]
MELKNYTYLLLLLFTIAGPLVMSFEKQIQYYRKLKYILPAILITAAFFLIWDIRFTEANIWSFNFENTIGIVYKGLPLEEWLFFIVIPYACIFIYEVTKVYLKKYEYPNVFVAFSLLLIVAFAMISYFFRHQAYTFLTFLFSAVFLTYTVFRNRFKPHMTKFYFAYFISIVPFALVNGLLNSLDVFVCNKTQILNIKILNFPVEDFGYLFLMLLMVTTIYETLKESKYY